MNADYETKIVFLGNEEERKRFINIVKLYSSRDTREAFFDFDLDSLEEMENDDSEEIEIEASGPWGSYGELNDVGIFREIAEATPNAELKAFITGSGTYEAQSLKARLKDKKLYIETYLFSYEDIGERYTEYLTKKLPYDEFVRLFKIDADEFDEDAYVEYMEYCAYEDEDQTISDISYEDFLENVEGTEIEEEEYNEIVEKLRERRIETYDEFKISGEDGCIDRLIYDPVSKDYCKGTVLPNGPFDATGLLTDQLKKEGNEKDPSELSLEEAYELLGKAFEKEDDDEETIEFFDDLFDDDFYEE